MMNTTTVIPGKCISQRELEIVSATSFNLIAS